MNGESSAALRPAGFWIRVSAFVLDLVLFTLVQTSLNAVSGRRWGQEAGDSAGLHTAVVVYTLFFSAVYFVVLHAATGQTVGKMLVGVRVVADDGGRVPFGTALLRYLGYWVALVPFAFGFVMAGLRRDKRGLHDLIAGTRVEHGPPSARRAASYPAAS